MLGAGGHVSNRRWASQERPLAWIGPRNPRAPTFLEEFDPFPKIFQFLSDNPTAFTFADVPGTDKTNHQAKEFWRIAGSILWQATVEDPVYVLSDLPEHPITIEILNDHNLFREKFYQDFSTRQEWAILAYNNHVVLPSLERVRQDYINNLKARGHYDELELPMTQD